MYNMKMITIKFCQLCGGQTGKRTNAHDDTTSLQDKFLMNFHFHHSLYQVMQFDTKLGLFSFIKDFSLYTNFQEIFYCIFLPFFWLPQSNRKKKLFCAFPHSSTTNWTFWAGDKHKKTYKDLLVENGKIWN